MTTGAHWSKSSAALLVIVGLSSSPALAAPVPRQFDFACKTEIAKRLNFKIVSERPSKPLTLHVDLDRQVWCQDRCSKRYAIQGVQGDAITLAHTDGTTTNTDTSIMPSNGGYSETYLVDLSDRHASTEIDGDCKVGKLTVLR